MKKICIITLSILLGTACKKETINTTPSVPSISKTVQFHIFQGQDYSASNFDNVQASVELSLAVEELKDGSSTIYWDTLIPVQTLRNYPTANNPLKIGKEIKGINPQKQVVRVSKKITYKHSDNHIYFVASGETIKEFENNKIYTINL